jgi:SAM-dependent methyltransferase
MNKGARQGASTAWFRSALGQALIRTEQRVLADLLSGVFGYHLVQVGCWGLPGDLMENARISHRILVCDETGIDARGASATDRDMAHIQAAPSALPLLADSIDAVLLPHTLEFSTDPHGVMREAHRVLVGEGHVLILGFNPLSAWTWRRLFSRRRFPSEGRPVPERRLSDWLAVLGVELVGVERYFYRLPVGGQGFQARTQWLERWGESAWPGPWPAAGYAVLGRKRLRAPTVIRPVWKSARRAAGVRPVST